MIKRLKIEQAGQYTSRTLCMDDKNVNEKNTKRLDASGGVLLHD